MNISLTPQLEKLVNKKVSSGFYHSASEVIREGLRLLKEKEELKTHRLRELRRELALGLDQADKGQLEALNIKTIKNELRNRIARRPKT